MAPRTLRPIGLSTIYADESDDKEDFVMAFIRVPTLVRTPDGSIAIDWDHWLNGVKEWRRALYQQFGVPISKELKGSKLATGRNRYWRGKGAIYGGKAHAVYKFALEKLDFLPDRTI